jgi:hypothetical protein
LDSWTKKSSSASFSKSPIALTLIVFDVSPGANVSVPPAGS